MDNLGACDRRLGSSGTVRRIEDFAREFGLQTERLVEVDKAMPV